MSKSMMFLVGRELALCNAACLAASQDVFNDEDGVYAKAGVPEEARKGQLVGAQSSANTLNQCFVNIMMNLLANPATKQAGADFKKGLIAGYNEAKKEEEAPAAPEETSKEALKAVAAIIEKMMEGG